MENWPSYQVQGALRSSVGNPLANRLVEMRMFPTSACGANSSAVSYSSAVTNGSGRYLLFQEEATGVLDGCMRLTAHADSGVLSASIVVRDTVMHAIPVASHSPVFSIDLTAN